METILGKDISKITRMDCEKLFNEDKFRIEFAKLF